METHGKEAGLTADDHGPGMHLLTPSGIAAELRSALFEVMYKSKVKVRLTTHEGRRGGGGLEGKGPKGRVDCQ